nr:MAG TPA: hypothetical protein [Caudoviricetes sp.]
MDQVTKQVVQLFHIALLQIQNWKTTREPLATQVEIIHTVTYSLSVLAICSNAPNKAC